MIFPESNLSEYNTPHSLQITFLPYTTTSFLNNTFFRLLPFLHSRQDHQSYRNKNISLFEEKKRMKVPLGLILGGGEEEQRRKNSSLFIIYLSFFISFQMVSSQIFVLEGGEKMLCSGLERCLMKDWKDYVVSYKISFLIVKRNLW